MYCTNITPLQIYVSVAARFLHAYLQTNKFLTTLPLTLGMDPKPNLDLEKNILNAQHCTAYLGLVNLKTFPQK
jgi:hypothetical protein